MYDDYSSATTRQRLHDRLKHNKECKAQRCNRAIDGFHGVWLQFQRVRVRVCVWCSCVQNTGNEVLH